MRRERAGDVSILDHADSVRPAPTWRCPACRTLQPETTRCWRCDTAAFSCGTCAFYRPSVAADLGSCAADPSRAPLRAGETRGCWESTSLTGPGAASGSPVFGAAGLFTEAEIAARTPAASLIPTPAPAHERGASERNEARSKPPLEAPGRAAWTEPHGDALVDAPTIEPGKRLSTEIQRRRRRWFR